jgi:hypothetical protein
LKNEYDILLEKKNLFAVPNAVSGEMLKISLRVAVFVHFYYKEVFEKYKDYVLNIPKSIDVFITTSNVELFDEIKQLIEKRMCKNVRVRCIQNRGRDVSALLVADRDEIKKYDYFCFIHDKGNKSYASKNETDDWNDLLWDNLINSENYISNVMSVFIKNMDIGLLVPPVPYSENFNYTYGNLWGDNYQKLSDLLNKLDVHTIVQPDIPLFVISTAFWAKPEALSKLFEYDWKYEDFDDEPLPEDGTISHVIERSLPFIAQSAGYDTGIVVCEEYQRERYFKMMQDSHLMYGILNNELFLGGREANLSSVDAQIKRMREYAAHYSKVYIYGAGELAFSCFVFMMRYDICVEGIVVSDGYKKYDKRWGIPVYEFSSVKEELACNAGIVIAVNSSNAAIVKDTLLNAGISDALVFFDKVDTDMDKRMKFL